jgi:hypothetical protein
MDDKLHDIVLGIAWAIAGVVLLWVLFGCSPCRHCTSTPQVDSLIINKTDTIIIRDTTYMYQPQDSTASNVVSDTEKSHLETDLATSDAWVENGQLHHNLSNKQDLIPIKVQVPQYISREEKYLIRTITKKVNELTQVQSFFIVLGKIFAILLAVFVTYKLLIRVVR